MHSRLVEASGSACQHVVLTYVACMQVGVWADAHHEQARKAGLDLIPDHIVTSVANI